MLHQLLKLHLPLMMMMLMMLMMMMSSFLSVSQGVNGQNRVFDESSPRGNGRSSLFEVLLSSQHDVSRRLDVQDQFLKSQSKLLEEIHWSLYPPRDCNDIFLRNNKLDKTYRVYPADKMTTDVFCDMSTPGGPWLVFQRRKDGSVDFYRDWKNYTDGFGDANEEFWLGNENLYLLTSNGKYKLRVELEDFDGNKRYAEYSLFSVSSSSDYYRLNVSGYSGNSEDSMSGHSGKQFTTKDADHDSHAANCASMFRGAWWYGSCHSSNLNGLYLRGNTTVFAQGVVWNSWLGYHYSLKITEMKISRID